MLLWGGLVLFYLFAKFAGALSTNENCEVPMIEGHLHLTSIRDTEGIANVNWNCSRLALTLNLSAMEVVHLI